MKSVRKSLIASVLLLATAGIANAGVMVGMSVKGDTGTLCKVKNSVLMAKNKVDCQKAGGHAYTPTKPAPKK